MADAKPPIPLVAFLESLDFDGLDLSREREPVEQSEARGRKSTDMLHFDHWSEWLQVQALQMHQRGVECRFRGRHSALTQTSNPGFTLEVRTNDRMGRISFWRNGLCDYEVLDTESNAWVVEMTMAAANDATILGLYESFVLAMKS